LVRGSPDINWDYAVIERFDATALKTQLLPFNLGDVVLKGDQQQNLPLMPGDIITVFSASDIQVPQAKQSKYIRLEGEFKAAGVYQILPGETLRKLLQRVGGATDNAYMYGAEFTRESTRREQQQRLNEAIDRLELEAQRAALARSQGVIAPEQAQSLGQQAAAQTALLAKLRSIQATGRIVLGLPSSGAKPADLPDLTLEDGDRLYLPPRPGTVSVFGAVYNQNSYLYDRGATASHYLSLAGGPTKDADRGSIYLVRADGSVVSSRQRGWFGSIKGETMMPGDAVVVPENFERFNWTKELKDWTQIFFQFALGVAGLKVLHDL
jgi:protein involved in polysaccharide export with SLBB domain